MPRPNLAERLTQLASLDDACLNRIHDLGFQIEIETNGKITMKPVARPDPVERKRKTSKRIEDAYG